MKNTILLLFALFLSSFALAKTDCVKGRQHIFLIHGIGGSEGHFGVMETYLEQINPCYVVTSFEYETGHYSKTPLDFLLDFNSFIRGAIKKNGFAANDRVSLIMHSQGGIVGSFWLRHVKKTAPELYKSVDAFITLSTPYWGSTAASVGETIFYTLPDGMKNPLSPFGKGELLGMKYGSGNINELEKSYEEIFFNTHVRPLAIGGLKPGYNAIYGEDDTTVSVYSSRPDHFVVNDVLDLKEEDRTIGKESFKRYQRIPFVPVVATHLKMDGPGVAHLPMSCLVMFIDCAHPSIGYILSHLQGKPILTKNIALRKYRVHFYLENVLGSELNPKDFSVEIQKDDLIPLPDDEELEQAQGGAFSFSYQGIRAEDGEGVSVVRLFYKNILKREFIVPVKGGVSSFVRVKVTRGASANAR